MLDSYHYANEDTEEYADRYKLTLMLQLPQNHLQDEIIKTLM